MPVRSAMRAVAIMIRAVGIILTLTAMPAAARAQGPWWGWGRAPASTDAWDPSRFADYLYTGHEPHPAVARIVAPEQSGTALGSGVLVDVNRAQGLVLTNWHVVRDSRSALLVQFADGFQSAGTVVRWDEAWDLAAVVIWKPPALPVTLAERAPAIGEPLTIAGFGRGVYREESGPCTDYLAPGSGYPKEFVELRARARQGDSGGAIFNERRELAGILFGQAEGRTIGSCSVRLRSFLATVGSNGFTAMPVAEFSDGPALARGIGVPAGPPERIAVASDALQRSTRVAGPVGGGTEPSSGGHGWPPPSGFAESPPTAHQSGGVTAPTEAAPPPAAVTPQSPHGGLTAPPPRRSIGTALLRAALSEGHQLLVAVGGFAVTLFGLRCVFAGRRFTRADG
jgi:hypothetical protein